MRMIDADALTDFLKCLLPERGMWEIDGDVGKNAVCETVAEAIEMVKNMETIKPETNCSEFPNNSDTISRQAAIEVASRECHELRGVFSDIEHGLKELPSVPRKGKWIDYSDEGYVECPFCHSATNCDGNKDELHYCFSCGADMRGDSDG